jgi:molecular chaperone DnaK
MKKEAEQYAEEDKKKKEIIELRNRAESLVFQSEKTLKDAGDKVTDDVKKPVQEKIDELKKTLENKDASVDDLSKGYETLSQEIQKVGAELYKATGEKAATEGAPADDSAPADDDGVKVYQKDEKKEDDVVDAEVVEEDDKDQKKKKK